MTGHPAPPPPRPTRLEILKSTYAKLFIRVSSWKTFLAQWQIGTKDAINGERQAIEEMREVLLRTHVNINALTALLIAKHVITEEDLVSKKIEVIKLTETYFEQVFKGATTTDAGIAITDKAAFQATKDRLGFPL